MVKSCDGMMDLANLPNLRCAGKEARMGKRLPVVCSFLCGRDSSCSDPVGGSDVPLRMEYPNYPDGTVQGTADFYCAKTYVRMCAKPKVPRSNFIGQIKTDLDVATKFKAATATVIEDMKAGRRHTWQDGKQSLKKNMTHNKSLQRPLDHFLPMEEYEEKFGDVSSKENKQLKHEVTTLHGIKGVQFPAPRGTLWTVLRSTDDELKHSQVIDDGEEVSDEGSIKRKFQKGVNDRETERSDRAKGASYNFTERAHSPSQSFIEPELAPARVVVRDVFGEADEEEDLVTLVKALPKKKTKTAKAKIEAKPKKQKTATHEQRDLAAIADKDTSSMGSIGSPVKTPQKKPHPDSLAKRQAGRPTINLVEKAEEIRKDLANANDKFVQ